MLHKVRILETRIFALLTLPVIGLNGIFYEGLSYLILQWAGLLCLIVCAFGRAFCSVYIGGRKNEELVMHGVFSIVRNPLYVFSFIGTIGIGLVCGSLLISASLAALFIAYYRMIVSKEEQFLTQKFGEHYLLYMKHVPRWIPSLSLWNSPSAIETRPLFVLKTFLDASVFFAAIPIIQLLHWLQTQAIIPVLFRLP